ncbi:MAG: phosphoribosyltransferase family protein [Clostridia bacterium]|nr:phosphoribosyltransferase family protein [Clostridia bacterium]
MFKNRQEAGEKLAESLARFQDDDVLVLAVPRGGLVTAAPAIMKYGFAWDLIIPRKLGSPYNEEYAIGAVAVDGTYFVDEYLVQAMGVTEDYIRRAVTGEVEEIKRRLRAYRGHDRLPEVAGKTVILIDDGIATGFTIQAAVESIRNQGAKKIILAVPVAPKDTVERFARMVDEVVCLLAPQDFQAVGQFYRDFSQTSDEEVEVILSRLRR